MLEEEKDRLIEILVFLYFNDKPAEVLGKAEFWNAIKNICDVYRIHSISISNAVRILMTEENRPQDEEIYYLLNKMGLTVRPIHKISGIYWQKQIEFAKKFETSSPVIKRRIYDPVIKKNIRDFLFALYDVLGIFSYVDIKLLTKAL